MTENFDWRENQTPGVMINPGTGPVHNATRELARENITALIQDARQGRVDGVTVEDTGREDEGRFTFILRSGTRTCDVDMPGLPEDEARYLGRDDQNILDFPRLYVEGSSWVWLYAIDQVRHYLLGEGA